MTSLVSHLMAATILVAIAQLVARAPRLSAAQRHLVLMTGLSAFVVLPLLSVAPSSWHVALPLPAGAREALARTASQSFTYWNAQPQVQRAPSSHPAAADAASPDTVSVAFALLLVWGAVAAGVALSFARVALTLRRIAAHAEHPSSRLIALLEEACRDAGVRRRVTLLESADVCTPMTWGVHRPTLLVPRAAETWSDESLRTTFLHELAHVQRLDVISLRAANGIASLLWFHPQVWIVRRWSIAASERACDDAVIRHGVPVSAYASHLVAVATAGRTAPPFASSMALSYQSQLHERVAALLSPTTDRSSLGCDQVALAAVFALVTFCASSLVDLAARPSEGAPPPAAAHTSPVDATRVVVARASTLMLHLPVNTGDPTRNPAEAAARQKLSRMAAARGAGTVSNITCAREINLRLDFPAAVVCQGELLDHAITGGAR